MHSARLIALCLVTLGAIATAGEKYDQEVFIDLAGRNATGSLPGARHSPDNVQWIGCSLKAYATHLSGFCMATNSQTVSVWCSTTSPHMLEAIKSITDSSFIEFRYDENRNCTLVSVLNASVVGPKK